MKLISPTNREVDIGQTLAPDEYIGINYYYFIIHYIL